MDRFQIGCRFSSYEEFSNVLQEYSTTTNSQFWISDSRTLQNSSKKARRVSDASTDLMYYYVTMKCIHGGTYQNNKSNRQRTTSTFRQNCPVFIRLILSKDAKSLQVQDINLVHNHVTTDSMFRHLPSQRRLPEDVQQSVANLMALRPNRKLLQKKIMDETGKVILLKDLSNISSKYKKATLKKIINLDEIVSLLQEKYAANVSLLQDKNILQGLFFQDPDMVKSFNAFPEMLFLDATYKLVDVRFSCFIFLIEDGNGNSEVVGVCLLANEDIPSVSWMMETLKRNNDCWVNIRAVMTDKDFVERHVISTSLPQAQLLICLFHTLQIFKREVTCSKMDITKTEEECIKHILHKMCYSYTEEEYEKLYDDFLKVAPSKLQQYFNKNWHHIRKEWTQMNCSTGNFLNKTNNRLESLNSKIKSVIRSYTSLSNFIIEFFVILRSLRNERDHISSTAVQKVSTESILQNFVERRYYTLLTPYAFNFLKAQLNASEKQKLNEGKISGRFTFISREFLHSASSQHCSCAFRKSMRLPCRHIFAARRIAMHDLFDENLCDKRWTQSYFMEKSRLVVGDVYPIPETVVSEKSSSKSTSYSDRYKTGALIGSQLASVAAESVGKEFEQKLETLQEILSLWKEGKEVLVSGIEYNTDKSSIKNNGENSINDNTQTPIAGTSRDLSSIHIPMAIKKRGHPKGFETTVIGLKKKKTGSKKKNS